nr:hypothetical protein [Escherichia coli]
MGDIAQRGDSTLPLR